MILLDTSLLSAAYRRRRGSAPEPFAAAHLRQLVKHNAPLAIPGIVFQELLSGVRTEEQFSRLQMLLESFPIVSARPPDHVAAARLFNACRSKGVAATLIDCLIASQAAGRHVALWSFDHDFARIARFTDLKLYHAP